MRVPLLQRWAEWAGCGHPAFLRRVSPPWVNRCPGILDVHPAPPRSNHSPHSRPPSRLWRWRSVLLLPNRREQNQLMGQGARRRPGPAGRKAQSRRLLAFREPGRRCPRFLPCLLPSPPPHLRPLSFLSVRRLLSLCPSRSPPHPYNPTRQPRLCKPSTQTLTLCDRNSSWQLGGILPFRDPLPCIPWATPPPLAACLSSAETRSESGKRGGRREGSRNRSGEAEDTGATRAGRHPNFLITDN